MLGILLADSGSAADAIARAEAGSDVQIFLMDDGVLAAPELASLIERGVEVTACAMDAEARGLDPTRAAGVRLGSQYDHAVMVRDSSELCAFTGCGVDAASGTARRVAVRLTRNRKDKLHHGLRSALAYAALGLEVEVRVDAPARAALSHPELERALATLRRFAQHPIGAADVEIRW